jgi:hypothetical protein
MNMTNAVCFHPKVIFSTSTLVAMTLMASGCATHPKAVPNWGGSTPPVASNNAPYQPPAPVQRNVVETMITEPANGRFTFTQGCTGNYSVRDTRTNRETARGRATNTGNGLAALDSRGRQGAIINATASQSVIFLPDCNCGRDRNQTGALPTEQNFAAAPIAAAVCTAG